MEKCNKFLSKMYKYVSNKNCNKEYKKVHDIYVAIFMKWLVFNKLEYLV